MSSSEGQMGEDRKS